MDTIARPIGASFGAHYDDEDECDGSDYNYDGIVWQHFQKMQLI